MPDLDTSLNWILVVEWYIVWGGSKNGYQTDMCLKRDWNVCSKYDNHSRLNR
jgi:hypothetical protein